LTTFCNSTANGSLAGAGTNSGISGAPTGLASAQLQSGLPAGFSGTIWNISVSFNNGFPYLLSTP
jgi:hypothetical protein